MPHIRLTAAAAAAAVVLAFALSPATARPCDDDDATCGESVSAQAAAPIKLDNFMKTWKPVAKSSAAKSSVAKSSAAKSSVAKSSAAKSSAAKSSVAKSSKSSKSSKRAQKSKFVRKPAVKENASEPAVAKTTPPPAVMETLAANPEPPMETEAAAVTSSNEVNEIDAAASQVQVVAFNEVNEIDLGTPAPLAPAESVGQSVSAQQPAADNSWMGKLLLAVAGTIALAGATRFLVA